MKRVRFISAMLLLLAPAAARAQSDPSSESAPGKPDARVFDEAWRVVRDRFYDRDLHGVDWKAVRDKHRPRAESAETRVELYEAVNGMLAELKASHLALVDGDVYDQFFAPEFEGRRTPRLGIELTRIDGRLFVAGLYEGGPAEKAGLRRGDELLLVDGGLAWTSPAVIDGGSDPGIPGAPHFVVTARAGKAVALTLRRAAEAEPYAVDVMPEKLSQIVATERSIRVVESGGRKYGYIHLWHFIHADITRCFFRAIEQRFADCDGLVLDIRGRGGSLYVTNAVLSAFVGRGDRDPVWTKPVVCLVDSGSRSAKEVFAHSWKERKVGPVVGERTAGAVLGSTFVRLSDGSALLVPVTDVKEVTGNVVLEGVGVDPTVPIEAPLPYAAGRDPIYDKGLDVLETLCKTRQAKPARSARGYGPF